MAEPSPPSRFRHWWRRRRLRIVFLLEDTDLYGGVKVVFQQADLLHARGHEVTVVSRSGPPNWYPLQARFVQATPLESALLPPADVTVATFWTTISAAVRTPSGAAAHFCQGFEGHLDHNRDLYPAIFAAYRSPIPCLAVSPHLAELVRRQFGRPARVVPPPVTLQWRPRFRVRPQAVPRIVVPSPFEIPLKGVPTALEAVRLLRKRGLECQLVRFSQWPCSEAESEMLRADEFHHRIPPSAVPALLRGADLLLAPSWEQEGFGLPALEAMACGVPVVASDISAFRSLAVGAAALVPFDDPRAFADAAWEILRSPARWRRMRRRGLAAAARFRTPRATAILERALEWVADRTWEAEIRPAQEPAATPGRPA